MEYRLGMVLSGGGSRGLAHVGVLKALAEEGIEPDCLSATSAGAIVAALYAAGYSPAEMLAFFETNHPFRVSRLALRKPGFIDTEKVVADFLEYFPDDSFEALGKKVFMTATDLVDARLEIFASGRLIPAILASSSAPMIFTPTEIDGRWYSDGGIIDNFPVDPLSGLCNKIVGVYASPLRTIDQTDLKSSLSVSMRALELGMFFTSRRRFHLCDLLICPEELAGYGNFDTRHYAEILDIGYRAARARMSEIVRLAHGS
ncbi:MAG: patatin-like phospholipase family protein [Thermoanaerobaculia bacterium]